MVVLPFLLLPFAGQIERRWLRRRSEDESAVPKNDSIGALLILAAIVLFILAMMLIPRFYPNGGF
jgi:hypothetical protein